MNDQISRQKLIEALEEVERRFPYKVAGKPDTYSEFNMAWESCMDCVFGAVESQPPADQWIPCSERLPNKDDYSEQGYVLAQYDIPQRVVQFLGYYDDFVKCWFDDAEEIVHEEYVIAWMPLPEPYKGVE